MKPPLFSCLTNRVHNNGSLYGRFLFGPLPIDISLTVATVLRRSLLHSQATFTIVSAEIEGANHEYASLPGIQESVLEILLNLGEIVLTTSQRNFLNPHFRIKTRYQAFYFAFIRVSGPGIILAKDIHWPKGIFCVKPNLVIATLSSNETLTMRLKIACSLNKDKSQYQQRPLEIAPFEKTKSIEKTSYFGQTNPLTKNDNSNILYQSKQNQREEAQNSNENDPSYLNNRGDKFEFFKLQGKASTISPISSSNTLSKRTSLLTSNFIRIKKENKISLKHEKTLVLDKKQKLLLDEQTKQITPSQLTKNIGSLDSYSIRKQDLRLPHPKRILSNKSIFSENTLSSYRNVTDIKNENDKKNNVTFTPFPGLFLRKTETLTTIKNNVLETSQAQDYKQLELDGFRQQKSKINRENIIENTPQTINSNKSEKYPLQVKSSCYPVEKVNFLIERDDELLGYRHRIILEVWTNGSISPRQAIFESIGSIIKLIYNFREPLRNKV